jgi:hypothetical protein
VSNDRTDWTEIDIVNPNPDDASTVRTENYTHTYTANVTPGLTKYFAIRPYRDIGGGNFKQGQMVYAPAASRTLGVPELSLSGDGPSYSEVTVAWTEAQKADTYRIKYWYTGEGNYSTAKTEATVHKNNLKVDAFGKLEYSFMPFENNTIDAAKAGLEIQVAVDALNVDLQTRVGGNEIATTSTGNVHTRLVGPALLNPGANHAVSPTDIDVSWNEVSGANGYYVFRRQFNMNNTAEEGTGAIVYYVPASAISVIDVTGKELALVSNEKTDTTTVKATASFANSRYTLKDMYMNDSEYGGGYVNHTVAYRNQQNDMAQGFSYRYYVVPVVNRGGSPEPLTSIEFTYAKDSSNKNTGISYYTIQEKGKNIRYNGAAAFEKDGFTIGFGQNVTATKGTYASSGNVNNGIQITWSAPPRLAGVAGFSPRYNVYRRATGSSEWVTLDTNINAVQYLDPQQTRGVAYEYVVGITNGNAGTGSQPGASPRFIERCGTLRDEKNRPNYLGFMLDTVRMIDVSRDERKDDNGNFGELVRWYSAGVKNPYSNDNNWGIDGYTIYVMNRNINANWHEFADVTNLSDQINQNFLAATGMKSLAFTSTGVNLDFDLLRVMRDYRHYFKVRSYVLNGDQKVYSPDPSYTWSNGGQNDYVKWGARQVTTDEYIKITILFIAWGVNEVKGTGWTSRLAGSTHNANGTGTSGSAYCESDWTVTSWNFRFTNYREDIQTRTGDWVTFIALNGPLWASTNASAGANNWGEGGSTPANQGGNPISIIGPSDTPDLYTGQMTVGKRGNSDLTWGGGVVSVTYPPGTANRVISYRGQDTALPYRNQGNERFNLEDYK